MPLGRILTSMDANIAGEAPEKVFRPRLAPDEQNHRRHLHEGRWRRLRHRRRPGFPKEPGRVFTSTLYIHESRPPWHFQWRLHTIKMGTKSASASMLPQDRPVARRHLATPADRRPMLATRQATRGTAGHTGRQGCWPLTGTGRVKPATSTVAAPIHLQHGPAHRSP